jgi:Domain of unknown function (DUF4129)
VNLSTWLAAGGAPDPVTRGGAKSAAESELAKRAYHRNDPSLAARAWRWVLKEIGKLLDKSAQHAPGHAVGLLLIVAIVAAVVILITVRIGMVRRTPQADVAIFGDTQSRADDHRRLAKQFAADDRLADAIREWLRAIARELEQRGVLGPLPGRTADELCREASAEFPPLSNDLRRATSTFDAVWYGGRTATADDEQLLRALDSRIAASRRGLLAAR